MADPARPLGLLGGTFDPIHHAHLRLAEEAREQLGLERVLFIPAGDPPHRPSPGAASAHRRAMVELALAGNPHFALEPLELDRPEPSYTHTTLTALRQREGPARPLVWIIGADAFAQLHRWYRWQALFTLTHFAIATRPGHTAAALAPPLDDEVRTRRTADPAHLAQRPAGSLIDFTMTPLDISATAIRANLACGASNRYLLPPAVEHYIHTHQPYPIPTHHRP